jgi:hypothetical protein
MNFFFLTLGKRRLLRHLLFLAFQVNRVLHIFRNDPGLHTGLKKLSVSEIVRNSIGMVEEDLKHTKTTLTAEAKNFLAHDVSYS